MGPVTVSPLAARSFGLRAAPRQHWGSTVAPSMSTVPRAYSWTTVVTMTTNVKVRCFWIPSRVPVRAIGYPQAWHHIHNICICDST